MNRICSSLLVCCLAVVGCASDGNVKPSGGGLSGATPDRPSNWAGVDGRTSVTPQGPSASQPRPIPPATSTSGSSGMPIPANRNANAVENPAAMVRPPVATTPADEGGVALSHRRVRALATEAQLRGEFLTAADLWVEALRLKPEDGEGHFALAVCYAGQAKTDDADALARKAADSARKAWENGITAAARYAGPEFALVAKEAAWIGLLAEVKARAEKLAAQGK